MPNSRSDDDLNVTCLIVDDEPPARSLLREYLDEVDHVEVVGECGTGREAVDAIHDRKPDLVFLDVQMPGLDGFDVLEQLDAVPFIIFSTAYDEYAIQAFDAGAVDYLLKPYSRSRFETAVDRVTRRIREARTDETPSETDATRDEESGEAPETGGDASNEESVGPKDAYAEEMANLLRRVREAGDTFERLYVRHGDKIIPVDLDAVQWIEAAGDYAKLHTESDTYLSSLGLGDLSERLDDRFARVHRSHVVRLSAIDHLRSDGSGGYVTVLKDGTRLRVSRSYAPQIRDRIV